MTIDEWAGLGFVAILFFYLSIRESMFSELERRVRDLEDKQS